MLANIGTARANQINKITSENWNDTGNNNEKQMADNWFPKCIKHCLDGANMCYLMNDICYTEEDKIQEEFDVEFCRWEFDVELEFDVEFYVEEEFDVEFCRCLRRTLHEAAKNKEITPRQRRKKLTFRPDVDRVEWINVLAVHSVFFLNWNFVPNIRITCLPKSTIF